MGSDKIPGGGMKKFEYTGYFDMYKLYEDMMNFFEGARNYDVTEKYYTEKNDQGNKEIKSYFDCELHYTDYYQLIIIIKVIMKGKDTELEVNGRKKILAKGAVKVIASRYIEVDFQNKRKSSSLMEFATKIYDKYFGTDEIGDCVQTMGKDIGTLKNIIKNHVLLLPDEVIPSLENDH